MEDVAAVAVLFQAAGSILLAIVIGQLAQIFSSAPARWWSAAWFAFAAALISVRIYIQMPGVAAAAAYLLFQWLFLALLWFGCSELTGGAVPAPRRAALLLPALVVVAILIASFARTFNQVFIVEAAIVAVSALASFLRLSRTLAASRGITIMRGAVALFAALYAAYVPLFLVHTQLRPLPWLSYSSFADLLVSVFVGCAMVIIVAEAEQRRSQDVVSELEQARSVVEQRLHTDALTEALSRHAFHWMKQGSEIDTAGTLSGVVVMADIDNLKHINDTFGHQAGDLAIRAVANALRGVIRGDDLLFRWGGDEFVAILPNLPPAVAVQRLAAFEKPVPVFLADGREVGCHISCGNAEFGPQQTIDEAIRIADERMYENRRARTV